MEETLALAGIIADNAPLAVRWSKHVMVRAAGVGGGGLEAQRRGGGGGVLLGRRHGGPVAFAEKRKPNWQGK